MLFVGRFCVRFGGPHGTAIEPAPTPAARMRTVAVAVEHSAPPATGDAPPVNGAAERAVWAALGTGSKVVRVAGEPGARTTALLARLSAQAVRHGFADGGLLLTGVRGPALDVGQRLAAGGSACPRRYYAAPELLGRFAGSRAVAIFDRPQLTAAEYAELEALSPGWQFVVGGTTEAPPGPTVELAPLTDAVVLALVEAGFGRPLTGVEPAAARQLAAGPGALPGRAQLIGIAARALNYSLAGVADRTGKQLVGNFIASLPALEQRVLGLLAFVPALLSADGLTAVLGVDDVRTSLTQLSGWGLIEVSGDRYELPRGIAELVPELSDAAVRDFAIATVCADLDDCAAGSLDLATAAEALVQTAFERSDWRTVLEVGPRAARFFGAHAAFGAWGRVLNLVAAAAKRVDGGAALSAARHELGVRSVLLGEDHKAITFLRSAAHDRQCSGDVAGAAASSEILTLVEGRTPPAAQARPVDEPAGANAPARSAKAAARRAARRPVLLIGLTLAVAILLCVGLWARPRQPAIARFSPRPARVAGGAATQLCVRATDAKRLEIAPDVGLLPADGEQCVAVTPAATTTYTAIATGSGGLEARRSITVAVQTSPVPRSPSLRIDVFAARPARIRIGDSTQLCYAAAGAELLRIVPGIGRLAQYRACRTIRPSEPGSRTYKIVAIGADGAVLIRRARIDVIAAPTRPPIAPPALPSTPAPSAVHPLAPPDDRLARRAVYQFDATPRAIERGQAASLCVGVGRWARGFLTDIGALPPGLTRCYRVHPAATRIYRLHVSIDGSTAVETVTIGVRAAAHPPAAARGTMTSDQRDPVE